ncbi:MAG: ABC transporter permease subunit [Erysipelotrichaceae bacterium]
MGKKEKVSLKNRFSNFIADLKAHPNALKSAVCSTFLMGSGQLRNKQKEKAAIYFGIFLLIVIVEIASGSYQYAAAEIAQFPASGEFPIYFFRDYGGFFTKGLWGLFTLGRVPLDAMYRGQYVETFNKVYPFLSADNSVTLLGEGLISAVILSIFGAFYISNITDAYKSAKLIEQTGRVESFKQFLHRTWEELFAFVILIPSMIMICFFTVIPFLFSFLLAFTNYTFRVKLPMDMIEWVGLANFSQIITDPAWFSIFGQVLTWTFIYAIFSSLSCYVMGFFQALVIESEHVKRKKIWRTIMIIPWAIPAMISLMVFKNVFELDGLANQLLNITNMMEPVSQFLFNIGLQGRPDAQIYWLSQPYNGNLAKFIVLAVNLWLGSPYFMMLITGVLTTLPKDLYEAAKIDGATKNQAFRKITMPLVLSATLPTIVMTFTFNFNNFGAIYFLTGGGPAWDPSLVPASMKIMGGVPGQTDILISWIYKLSFSGNAQLYNIAAVYSILIFAFVGFIAVFNLSRSKGLWED